MTGTAARIRWEDDGLSGNHVGHAGTLAGPAFRIYSPDAAHGNWLLSIRLAPGNEFIYGASQDELKAEAERWLDEFVSSLGAVFPEPPTPDPDCEECGFGLPRHDKDCSYYPETTAAMAAREKDR